MKHGRNTDNRAFLKIRTTIRRFLGVPRKLSIQIDKRTTDDTDGTDKKGPQLLLNFKTADLDWKRVAR
jgi:hypothetical protein